MSQAEQLSPLKQAFLAIEKLQNKLDKMQQAQTEPIAIIGMGCRFPHGANTPQAFWELLHNGRDGISEIPADRWDADAYFDPDPQKPGKIGTRWGGFLDNVTGFDARFFGITPREAIQMDPQQRLLLEVAWEALEMAGQTGERLSGSLTGVYVGLLNSEYGWLQLQDVAGMDAYSGTGTSHSVASGRLSYFLGLQGPSVTLDTACSSSLVAMHMACQALRAGECHLALAGGVSVMLSPLSLMPFTRMGLLAKDGRCKTLDARADGFVGGEGCGIVVLKRLSDAQADGDPILALIRGSAVNQDGRTNVLSAPNGRAQTAVIRQALANAQLSPEDISFVEMHGTGTVYGDPIEVEALREVFGDRPDDTLPCPLGAVKSAIGHTAAAAGVAGVIKTILALQNEAIPPNLHFQELNPHITFDGSPFTVPVKPQPWPADAGPRCAGISSFGWSGTNAHLILSDSPSLEPGPIAKSSTYLLPLSARDPHALRQLAVEYRDHLQEMAYSGSQSVAEIVYSAAVRRSHHSQRAAVIGRSHYQLAEQLRLISEEQVPTHPLASGPTRKLVFVFSPHGGQWLGMGRRLWSQSAVFREALSRCQAAMSAYVDWSLIDKLTQDTDAGWLEQIDVLQPTLFALQVALAEVWRAWGVEPDAIVGHSMGEVAAAHIAGVLSLDDAARIICRRTQLLSRVRGEGAMGMVELSYQEAQAAIAPFNGRLHVAVSNSPRSTVVGGDPDALEALFDQLLEQEIFCGWGVADVASHSPKMDALREELRQAIGEVKPAAARIPLYSTVTGAISDGYQCDGEYWVRHLNQPVLFADAVCRLAENGHNIFLEISPAPVLAPAIEEGLHALGHKGAILASLRRDKDEYETLLATVGELYTLGYPVSWSRLYPQGNCVPLPTYPWQRERFWLAAGTETSFSIGTQPGRSLAPTILGQRLELAADPRRELWENRLDRRLLPHLFDYRPFGTAVLPAAAYLEMALLTNHTSPFTIHHLQFSSPLPLAEEAPWSEIQMVIGHQFNGYHQFDGYRQPDGAADFAIYGRHQAAWHQQATGHIEPLTAPAERAALDLDAIRQQCRQTTGGDALYSELGRIGLAYGPDLQTVVDMVREDGQALGRLHLVDSWRRQIAQQEMPTAVLEAAFQLLSGCLAPGERRFLVTAVTTVDWLQPGIVPEWVHVTWQPAEGDTVEGRAVFVDGQGTPLLALDGIRLQEQSQPGLFQVADSLYGISWQTASLPEETAAATGRWLILADDKGVGAALAGQLQADDQQVILVETTGGQSQTNHENWCIRPDHREDYEALLTAVFAPDQPPCRAIIYLWGLNAGNDMSELDKPVGPLLHLAQTLKQLDPDAVYPIWLATQGAQPLMGPPVAVAQAALWGLGLVLAEEQRELWGGLVDLDPAAEPEQSAAQLRSQIERGRGEERVAFRAGQRYAARLSASKPMATVAPSPWRADATYLITGGLGEIALQLAPWAVAQGARRLVLLGRSPLPPRTEWAELDQESRLGRRVAAIRALEGLGASVHYAAVDVGDEEQLYDFLDRYAAEGRPPIRGVIHAAAVIEDRLLLNLDEASLRRTLHAKAGAAWLLHRYFDEQRPLDFFVLFSSIASLLGSAGQGSYAAANAFLDSLAHLRRAQGRPALSINWGFWGDVGFATTAGGRRVVAYMRDFGLSTLTNTQALDALATLLAQPDLTQTAVLRADWQRWAERGQLVGLPPFLQLVTATDEPVEALQSLINIREQLTAVAPGPIRVQKFHAFLRDQLANVLKTDPVHIDRQTPLGELGIDSFTAIDLRNRLERALGITLSATVAWEYPTITAMAPYLAGKMALPLTPEPAADTPEMDDDIIDDDIAAFLSQAGDLSEEELRRLLRPSQKK